MQLMRKRPCKCIAGASGKLIWGPHKRRFRARCSETSRDEQRLRMSMVRRRMPVAWWILSRIWKKDPVRGRVCARCTTVAGAESRAAAERGGADENTTSGHTTRLAIVVTPNSVVSCASLSGRNRTVSGYYNDLISWRETPRSGAAKRPVFTSLLIPCSRLCSRAPRIGAPATPKTRPKMNRSSAAGFCSLMPTRSGRRVSARRMKSTRRH